MKVTIIHGQSHKGSTYHIANMLGKKLNGEVTEFFLPKDFGAFCVGCNSCFTKSEDLCPHNKNLKVITAAMDEADVLILASPVYVYHSTGAMKAFLDHYGYRWMVHRPEEKMFKKQAVCISTAAGSGMKSANKDMADSTFFWGVAKTYTYGIRVAAVSWHGVTDKNKQRIEKETTKLANTLLKKVGTVKPGLKTKAFFYLMKMLHKKAWNEADVKYWNTKGWNQKKRPWK